MKILAKFLGKFLATAWTTALASYFYHMLVSFETIGALMGVKLGLGRGWTWYAVHGLHFVSTLFMLALGASNGLPQLLGTVSMLTLYWGYRFRKPIVALARKAYAKAYAVFGRFVAVKTEHREGKMVDAEFRLLSARA